MNISHLLAFVLLISLCFSCDEDQPVYNSLEEYPIYPHNDLGVTYTKDKTTFKLWSPVAQRARVRLFDTDDPSAKPTEIIDMKVVDGAWKATVEGDLDETYYTYQVKRNGAWQEEATDIYARAVGVNGARGQVVDLSDTHPEGWKDDIRPPFTGPTNVIIYEMHLRDFSIDPRSGIEHKGKYLSLTESGTHTPQGDTTGIDHLKQLGVTHVHLLPVFDFDSINENRLNEAQYNWGYDPQNYNVPEGSYATDVHNGKVRIREFKQMVQALHQAGIRVVMDVVYNHTSRTERSNFQRLIPDYFYRLNEDGSFSDASGCKNEIASERPMVRKFIRESLSYWVREYHIDGFRFDLMGVHDIATMNEISQALRAIDPTILLYGEGWKAGSSPMPDSLLALKRNVPKLKNIAAFSDDIRDALKGSVFEHTARGFVSGAQGKDMSVRFGIVGATSHPQVDMNKVNYSDAPWAPQPTQCINYVSCHDNHTLWDRLKKSNPQTPRSRRAEMQRLALAIVLTSQGIPFLHSGVEMHRSKNGVENSYKSSDGINAIWWKNKRFNHLTFNYVRWLIDVRKKHPAFRLGSTQLIQKHLTFIDTNDEHLIIYRIQDAPGDTWKDILVVFNGDQQPKRIDLPEGQWLSVVDGRNVDTEGLGDPKENKFFAAARSANILIRLDK